MARVLVVDDEKLIVKGIRFSLEQDGFEVDCAYDGEEAIEKAKATEYDMVLLDVMLPKRDGIEVCQAIREFSEMPIIMLTAKGGDMDKILGLEYGADDYITKPFSPKELVLRVNNIMKRTYKSENTRITIDSYELDEEQRKVFDDKVEIDLTTKEFDLLMMFIKNKGIAFSREKILENVWEDNYFGSDRVVDDTLRRLRKKLPKLNIHTIYGYGYRLG